MAIIIASFGRLRLRLSKSADWDFVLQAEQHPDNRDYVASWTLKQHQQAADHPDSMHLIIEWDLESAGYAILSGLEDPSHSLQLMRLVVTEKHCGIGRETIRLLQKLAFTRWGAHRLWLHVRSNNNAALSLYRAEGFVEEGLLRECVLIGEGGVIGSEGGSEYLSLRVMSILEQEYRQRQEA